MNIKRQQLIIDIINIIMRFIPAYLFIVILLNNLTSQSALHTLILLPAPILSYLIKKHTRHIWSFLILHGIVLAIYLTVVSDIYLRTAIGIYIVILTVVAYYKKNKGKERENTPAVLLILFVMFYIACSLVGMQDLLPLCFNLSIVYVLLFVVNTYLFNLEKFVYNHEGMNHIPFRQIRNSNSVLILFLSSLFLVSMLIFSLIPLDRYLAKLGKLIIRLLRFLFSLLRFEEPEDILEPEEEQMAVEDFPITEPSRLMEIIMEILQWVAIILVIALIVALIVYTLYQIYQYFYLKSEDKTKDKIEFLSPFLRKERVKREHKKIIRRLFGRSNNALIRKFFTQAVTANLTSDTKLDKSLTPSQLSNFILPSTNKATAPLPGEGQTVEQINAKKQITEYYEKARYSNEECSKDEVQTLKKLLKEIQ